MDKRILACAVSMAAGVNFLPWTGPMIRASAALKLPISEIFNPLIGVQLVGLAFIFTAAYLLGRREERRLGLTGSKSHKGGGPGKPGGGEGALRGPKNIW